MVTPEYCFLGPSSKHGRARGFLARLHFALRSPVPRRIRVTSTKGVSWCLATPLTSTCPLTTCSTRSPPGAHTRLVGAGGLGAPSGHRSSPTCMQGSVLKKACKGLPARCLCTFRRPICKGNAQWSHMPSRVGTAAPALAFPGKIL